MQGFDDQGGGRGANSENAEITGDACQTLSSKLLPPINRSSQVGHLNFNDHSQSFLTTHPQLQSCFIFPAIWTRENGVEMEFEYEITFHFVISGGLVAPLLFQPTGLAGPTGPMKNMCWKKIIAFGASHFFMLPDPSPWGVCGPLKGV